MDPEIEGQENPPAGGGTLTTDPATTTAGAQDAPAVGGGAERPDWNSPGASSQATPTPTTTGTAPATTAPVPADPNQRAGATQTQAQTGANDWQSIREAASAYGYQFDPAIQDDRAALVHLLQRAQANQQADFYAQLGRQLAPQAQSIQQFLAQQSQPQQAQGRQPWEAPEFDERWAGLVQQDPTTGLYVAKQGVPHEIAQKVNEYVQWKTNFDRNPGAVLNGMVEARAKEIARSTFNEQFAAQARQQTIGQIVQENSAWLYQQGPDGRPAINPVTGQYQATPVGARYMFHVQALQQAGVKDPRVQDTMAKNLVRGEYALAQQQHAAAAAGQAGNVQTQQAIGRSNTNPLQALPPTQRQVTPGATEPTGAGLSLSEMLRGAFAAEGVRDQDFAIPE
jgi:hypothetical protein